VLEDLQYVYQALSDIDGGNFTIGCPYSMLEWHAEAHPSWSLPLDVRRISSGQTAQEVVSTLILAPGKNGLSKIVMKICVALGVFHAADHFIVNRC